MRRENHQQGARRPSRQGRERVLVNAFLVAIWAITNPHAFFWPVFFIGIWGIGLVMNAWDVYWRKEITEEDIQQEVERGAGRT